MQSFRECINNLNVVMGKVCSFIAIPLICIVIYELILRYLFDNPTSWVHELSGFLLGAYTLLTAGFVQKSRGHVNVDIFVGKFSARIQTIIRLLTSVLFFFFVGVIIWCTGKGAIESVAMWEHTSTMWGPLYWPVRLYIPIGAILLLLQGIVQFIEDLSTIKGRKI